jgi:hypothetical protein
MEESSGLSAWLTSAVFIIWVFLLLADARVRAMIRRAVLHLYLRARPVTLGKSKEEELSAMKKMLRNVDTL